jgi:hypothetical protein
MKCHSSSVSDKEILSLTRIKHNLSKCAQDLDSIGKRPDHVLCAASKRY